MRIAITTWHTGPNSGTFFQLYGLYQYLKSRGHDVKVIDYIHQPEDQISRGMMYFVSQALPLVRSKIKKIRAAKDEKALQLPFAKQIEERDERFKVFWSMLDYTSPVRTQEEFDALNDNFDAFVVGSDQVWNATMLNRRYLLDYVHDDKLKVAYGPSVGVGNVLPYQRKVYKHYVGRFSHVAVRERLLCDILNAELPNLHAQHLLDPSMLYPREEYLKIARLPRGLKSEQYLLCYFAPKNEYQEKIVVDYAKKNNLKIVVMAMFGYSWKMRSDMTVCADASEFVGLISNAAAVFTSSFHCTIFSIMFHRNLFVFESKKASKTADINQRYTEQLRTYKMEHRYIREGETLNDEILKPIDYEMAEKIFQQRLKESRAFLDNIF